MHEPYILQLYLDTSLTQPKHLLAYLNMVCCDMRHAGLAYKPSWHNRCPPLPPTLNLISDASITNYDMQQGGYWCVVVWRRKRRIFEIRLVLLSFEFSFLWLSFLKWKTKMWKRRVKNCNKESNHKTTQPRLIYIMFEVGNVLQ